MTRSSVPFADVPVSRDRRALLAGVAASIMLARMTEAGASEQGGASLAQQLMKAAPSIGDRNLGRDDAKVTLIEYASATS